MSTAKTCRECTTMEEQGVCFGCALWLNRLERGLTIIEGHAYSLGSRVPSRRTPSSLLGMAGREQVGAGAAWAPTPRGLPCYPLPDGRPVPEELR